MVYTGRLFGKVAIVSGEGGGFGTDNVQKFVREGAKVVVVDTQPSIVTKMADAFPSSQVLGLQSDAASETDWKVVTGFIFSSFHQLDVAVNKAGVNPGAHSTINSPLSKILI